MPSLSCRLAVPVLSKGKRKKRAFGGTRADIQNTVEFTDTSQKTRKAYFDRLKEMTPSERLSLGIALWQAGDSVQRAAVRRRDPQADEAEIAFQIAATRFGLELAQKAYRRK